MIIEIVPHFISVLLFVPAVANDESALDLRGILSRPKIGRASALSAGVRRDILKGIYPHHSCTNFAYSTLLD